MTLELPWPPSTNHAYAVRNGRKVKTKRARDYAYDVETCVYASDTDCDWLEVGPLAVTILVYPPDKRRRDLANIEKLAIDAVFKILGWDDSRIDRLTLERAPVDRQNPRLVLTIEVLP